MNRSRTKRNIAVYIAGVLALSSIGGFITASGNEIGGLIFVASPILVAMLLRSLGRDGWGDAGLRLNARAHWRWYLFSLFAYPAIISIIVASGTVLGLTEISGDWNALVPLLTCAMGGQFIIRVPFALFEEWGWRGYLEPRLLALGMSDMKRHVFVGTVWAVWHLPLILSTDYTDNIPRFLFLPFFVIGVVILSIVYGQLRKLSGTVWTSVLLHGAGNAFVWGLIQSDAIAFHYKLLAYVGPESVMSILLFGLLAFWMRYRGKAGQGAC